MLFLFTSCYNKFNKTKWEKQFDGSYPERDKILDDLLSNYNLRGLTYWQLVNLLGKPEHDPEDSGVYYYQIAEDFGHDIDPVYIKNLEFILDKDSIVLDYKIKEYKH